MFVVSSLPFINPYNPRLNSDLIAFFGLSLFGWVSCFVLPRPSQRVELGSLGFLCGLWLLWACVQYIAGVNTTYFSYLLVSLSYLLATVLLSIWVKMWLQAGLGKALAQTVMSCVLIAGLIQAASIWLQMFQLEGWLSPWLNTSASFPRQNGFLAQPNLCASLMVCALVCLVFLHPEEGRESARPSAWRLIAMAFMMFAIYATSSRTGYLEILVLSAVLLDAPPPWTLQGLGSTDYLAIVGDWRGRVARQQWLDVSPIAGGLSQSRGSLWQSPCSDIERYLADDPKPPLYGCGVASTASQRGADPWH